MHDLLYRDVCMRDVKNPLVFTPLYTTFTGDLLPVYRDITLKMYTSSRPAATHSSDWTVNTNSRLTLDNVFADEQPHSTMLNKDAVITIGKQLGNLEPAGENVALNRTPDSTAGKPLACDARFVPFPADDKAPEMAGTIPPEDKTYYVAADGTGDYYSIQRAIDTIPASGDAMILIAPGTYREVLTINKPSIQLRSANPDASKTVVVNDQECRRERRHPALSHRECDVRQLLRREHHLRERLQSNASATSRRFPGSGPAGHRRSRHLPQRAPARQPGHRICRQPQLFSRWFRLHIHPAVFLRLLHRRQRRFHLRRWQSRL